MKDKTLTEKKIELIKLKLKNNFYNSEHVLELIVQEIIKESIKKA